MKRCLIDTQLSPGMRVQGATFLLERDVLLSPAQRGCKDEPSYLVSLKRNKTYFRGISSPLLQLCSDIHCARP